MDWFKTWKILLISLAVLSFFPGITSAKGLYLCNGKTATVGQTMEQVENSIGAPDQIESTETGDQNKAEEQYETEEQGGTEEQSEAEGRYEAGDPAEKPAEYGKWIYKCESRTYAFLFKNQTLITIRQISAGKTE